MLYFFIIFGIFIVGGLIYTFIYQNKMKKDGIETEGIVRTSTQESWINDGFLDETTYYYVKYKNESGEEVEASIGNAKTNLKDRDKIRIKYMPKNPKYAYFIEKIM